MNKKIDTNSQDSIHSQDENILNSKELQRAEDVIGTNVSGTESYTSIPKQHSQDEKILNEVMKDFEEKFKDDIEGENWWKLYSLLEEFLKQAITKAQKSAREEEYKRCCEILDRDHKNCVIKESCIGYQNAHSDLLNNPQNL